jgi:hypothetical protein
MSLVSLKVEKNAPYVGKPHLKGTNPHLLWPKKGRPNLWRVKGLAVAHPFIAIVIALCVGYASMEFTPSSYARVLKGIGVEDTGLLLGTPHQYRFDEWAIWTPLMQIAVNNHFERYNHTSPYGEDLRNFTPLPLLDWAIPFKPQQWVFFALPPAIAFSIMYAVIIAACLIGWYLLALSIGFGRLTASLFSVTIFALPFTQLWWTTMGPPVAFLPWVLIAYLIPRSDIIRLISVTYTTTVFLLSETYTPFLVTLVFGAVIVVVAFRRDAFNFRHLASGSAGAAVGCGLVAMYLWDPMQIMMATVYPGQRISVGGGTLPHTFILAHMFPHFISNKYDPFYWNELEIATGGSYAIFFTLILLDYRAFLQRLRSRDSEVIAMLAPLMVLSAGVALILAWWLLPIPSGYGVPLQWNTTMPQRLAFTFGLLCHLIIFILVLKIGLVTLAWRFVAAIATLIGAAILSKFVLWHGHASSLCFDLFVIVPFAIVFLMRRRIPQFGLAVLACAAVSNAVLFISYNPLQRAGPIFARHDTPTMRSLTELQENNRNHWLVPTFIPGSVQNGLGFRSITQVMMVPELVFFRQRFPDMPAPEFNYVFNRFAQVIVDPEIQRPDYPRPLVIRVPALAFE